MNIISNDKKVMLFSGSREIDNTPNINISLDSKIDPCVLCKYEDDGDKCPYMGQVKKDGFICDSLQIEENTHPNVVAEFLKQDYSFKTLQDTKEVYVFFMAYID